MANNPNGRGEALAYLTTTLAVTLSRGLSTDDLNILSAFLNALADNLALLASQRDTLDNA